METEHYTKDAVIPVYNNSKRNGENYVSTSFDFHIFNFCLHFYYFVILWSVQYGLVTKH